MLGSGRCGYPKRRTSKKGPLQASLQNCTDGTPAGNVLDFSMGYNAGTTNNGNLVTSHVYVRTDVCAKP
jgi:hypothetical protein